MTAAVKQILAWPLWSVLLCGIANVLLWERGGEIFMGSLFPILLCVFALPVIAGFLNGGRLLFTVFVFAFSSGLPFVNDMPPIVIGLWPFYWIWTTLRGRTDTSSLIELSIVLVLTAGALILMFVPYMFLVGAGRFARRKFSRML
jgi:hypothetical protein